MITPVEFAEDVQGMTLWTAEPPHAGQREILEAVAKYNRITVKSGHGIGKTVAAALAAVWFLVEHKPALVITTAPTFRQVEDVLWPEMRKFWHKIGLPWAKVNLTQIKLGDDRRAFGFSSDEPQRLQGLHCENIFIIVDEAEGVATDIYDALRGMLTSENAKFLLIGNPLRPEGYFYESHQPGSGFKQLTMSCMDSPNVKADKIVIPGLTTRKWIEDCKKEWPGLNNPVFVARVLGEFPKSAIETLVPREWVQAALDRGKTWNGHAPKIDKASLRLGCDVARYGSDLTVIMIADKLGVRHASITSGCDLMETVGRVIRTARLWGIAEECIAIDDTGVGGGVTDRLWEQNIGAVPVNFGERALDFEHFTNQRAEMYWQMREALNPERNATFAIPPEYLMLLKEMSQPHYTFDSRGRIKIEPKADIKKRLGKSPDHADALALCFVPPAPSMKIERI